MHQTHVAFMALVVMAGQAEADRIDSIRENALRLPDTNEDQVREATEAAIELETERVPAGLLVSLMWAESRFVPDVKTGRACGVMQVVPEYLGKDRSACDDYASDVKLAVSDGIKEIEVMLDDRRVNGDMWRALMYRACGNSFFDGKCRKAGWVKAAIRRWHRLKGE